MSRVNINNTFRYLLIILSVALAGCTKGITAVDDDCVFVGTRIERTKTTFQNNLISFKYGDCVGLNIKDVINIGMSNTNNIDPCYFSGNYRRQNPAINEADYYFYYPYRATQQNEFEIELNSRQRAPFDSTQNYMYAEVIHDKYDETDMPELSPIFHQTFAIVAITIQNDESDYQDEILKGISLTADEDIVGSFTYSVYNPGSVTPISGETSSTVYSFFPEKIKLGNNVEHKVFVQIKYGSLHNVKINVYTDGHVFTSMGSKSFTASQDHIFFLNPINISDMTPEAVVTTAKRLVCWGDSATCQGNYPGQLCSLLGSNFTCYNRGVGGDNSIDIAARQGGIPMFLLEDVVVKDGQTANLQKGVYINKNTAFETVNVLLALYVAGRITWPLDKINPVRINGAEYNLTSFKSLEKVSSTGSDVLIPSGSIIEPYDSYTFYDTDIAVIYVGLNGLFDTTESLMAQIDAMVNHLTTDKCLILGFHNGRATSEYVSKMSEHFGRSFIDLRNIVHDNYPEMLVKAGVYASVEDVIGSEDEKSIQAGEIWPCSFMKSDKLHFTDAGGKIIAILAYDRMQELGYLDN